jgi:hypothetical protein
LRSKPVETAARGVRLQSLEAIIGDSVRAMMPDDYGAGGVRQLAEQRR